MNPKVIGFVLIMLGYMVNYGSEAVKEAKKMQPTTIVITKTKKEKSKED